MHFQLLALAWVNFYWRESVHGKGKTSGRGIFERGEKVLIVNGFTDTSTWSWWREGGDFQGEGFLRVSQSFSGNEKFGSRKETLVNIEKVRNSIFNDTSWEFRLWGRCGLTTFSRKILRDWMFVMNFRKVGKVLTVQQLCSNG
jgi:hypothetical protein